MRTKKYIEYVYIFKLYYKKKLGLQYLLVYTFDEYYYCIKLKIMLSVNIDEKRVCLCTYIV